jgi:tetratricopeptide (TPR) repeat protein
MSTENEGKLGASPAFEKGASASLWTLRRRRAAKKFDTWRSRRCRTSSSARTGAHSTATSILQGFYTFISRLPWAIAVIAIVALLIRGLTEYVTIIEPISVPKALADSGYTQEVAAKRLRDAMVGFVTAVNARMNQPEMALNSELPNVVVPTVGVSLDAVMSSLRTLLRITRTRSVSGEFVVANNQLLLRLRLNGREFYTSTEGGVPNEPDEVLKLAVPEVLKKIQPYVVAVSLRHKDPEAALELANWIISELPIHNENVAWAHNFKGNLLRERKDYRLAEDAYRKAFVLGDVKVKANVHNNLGILFKERGDIKSAVSEYRRAIALDQNFPMAHYNLGLALRATEENEKAIAAFREALRLDPKYAQVQTTIVSAMQAVGKNLEAISEYKRIVADNPNSFDARNALGNALQAAGRIDEAITQYREAVKINPKYDFGYSNLGFSLAASGKNDEAVVAYRKALELNPRRSAVRNNLGLILDEAGKSEEAILEYREAIKLNDKFVDARNNLGIALNALGRYEDAIAEFRSVLELEPRNEIARDHLDVILSKLPANG